MKICVKYYTSIFIQKILQKFINEFLYKKTLMDFFRTSSVIYFGNPYEKASKKSSNDTFRNKRFRIPQEFFLRKSFKVPLRNDSRYSFGNYLQYSSMDLSRDSFKKYSLNFFRNCYIAFNSYIFFKKT